MLFSRNVHNHTAVVSRHCEIQISPITSRKESGKMQDISC